MPNGHGDTPLGILLEQVPEPRRHMLERLDAVIRAAAPALEPSLWGDILGYGSYHYRYASGREGDGSLSALPNGRRT